MARDWPKQFVLDTSFAAKCIFEEQGSAQARLVLAGADYVVGPALVRVEAASIIIKKRRRDKLSLEDCHLALAGFDSLYTDFVPDGDLIDPALELASRAMVALQDALFAALAQRRALPLLTADARLQSGLRGVSGAPEVFTVAA